MDINEILLPHSLEDAKKCLIDYGNASILAGGTDLMLSIKHKKINPQYIISLGKIKELKKIKEFGKNIMIGSMVTFRDIKDNISIRENLKCLFECSCSMGAPQIRNTATIGGNIINAASAADSIPCLMVLDAVFVFESEKSKRLVKCSDYFENYSAKKIKPNEILTQIIVEKGSGKSSFYKLGKRNSLAVSRINSAAYIKMENSKIKIFRLSLGAADRYPFRVYGAEDAVKGKEVKYLFDREAINIIKDEVYNRIKSRKSMPFKKEAVIGVYKQTINDILRSDVKGEVGYFE